MDQADGLTGRQGPGKGRSGGTGPILATDAGRANALRSGWESRPESACRLRPARGKSKAERGENLVGRTVCKTERSVCTHFANQDAVTERR